MVDAGLVDAGLVDAGLVDAGLVDGLATGGIGEALATGGVMFGEGDGDADGVGDGVGIGERAVGVGVGVGVAAVGVAGLSGLEPRTTENATSAPTARTIAPTARSTGSRFRSPGAIRSRAVGFSVWSMPVGDRVGRDACSDDVEGNGVGGIACGIGVAGNGATISSVMAGSVGELAISSASAGSSGTEPWTGVITRLVPRIGGRTVNGASGRSEPVDGVGRCGSVVTAEPVAGVARLTGVGIVPVHPSTVGGPVLDRSRSSSGWTSESALPPSAASRASRVAAAVWNRRAGSFSSRRVITRAIGAGRLSSGGGGSLACIAISSCNEPATNGSLPDAA